MSAASLGALPVGAEDERRWPLATLLALLLEIALFGAAAWLIGRTRAPQPLAPVQIVLEAPRPAPKPLAPPVVKPKPPKPTPPKPRARPRPLPRPLPTPVQPRIVTPPAPTPQTRPAMPVAPPPPPPPKPAKPDPEAVKFSFEAALREAIQATVHFPEAARLMHLQGRTLVRFTFRDGHVSAIRIVTSSGVPPLDQAAIAAVRNAPCPPTPAALAGRALSFEIWVRFHLDSP